MWYVDVDLATHIALLGVANKENFSPCSWSTIFIIRLSTPLPAQLLFRQTF